MNVHVLTFYDDTNRTYGYDDEPLYLVGVFTNHSDAIEAMKEDSSEIIQDAVSSYRITTMTLDVRNMRQNNVY